MNEKVSYKSKRPFKLKVFIFCLCITFIGFLSADYIISKGIGDTKIKVTLNIDSNNIAGRYEEGPSTYKFFYLKGKTIIAQNTIAPNKAKLYLSSNQDNAVIVINEVDKVNHSIKLEYSEFGKWKEATLKLGEEISFTYNVIPDAWSYNYTITFIK